MADGQGHEGSGTCMLFSGFPILNVCPVDLSGLSITLITASHASSTKQNVRYT